MSAPTIKRIERSAVNRICADQVIVDLATAVKELVENSLDAGATSIQINFRESGAELIEIADNGSGIDVAEHGAIGLKHHTSKIECFEDLSGVQTYGFRGEAISSICAMANVTMVTATEKQAPHGHRLTYDRQGQLVSTSATAREVR
jgi:DNA mismatch repair protein PMS2